MRNIFTFIREKFALIVVIAVFVWASAMIAMYRNRQAPAGATMLRIGHWQLEASVRDALNEMARRYRELHPDVYIIQDAIPESVYGQWVSTQLMGGTAPDMVQAIRNALADIEGELAMMPWRCHVTGVREQQMIIDRGYIDGLREGAELQGYAMDSIENAGRAAMSDEEFLMTHGMKAGSYRVVEAGQNFSKVEPVDNAPVLKAGDVLQTPEIRFKDRLRKTRGQRAWDKLYSD